MTQLTDNSPSSAAELHGDVLPLLPGDKHGAWLWETYGSQPRETASFDLLQHESHV